MPPKARAPIAALLALAWAAGPTSADDAPKPDVATAPAFEEFVVVPLRVHVLTSDDLPEVACALKDEDILRVVAKVNGIWHAAGVHWALDPIVREPAARQDRFREAKEKGQGDGLGRLPLLAPEGSRSKGGMDVYYIHKFAANGVFLGRRMAFVQETAKLRPVEGGIDEPLPRVTAHELGHALGLPHRQARFNLLASGTTGTILNAAEAAEARGHARDVPGALAVPEARKRAADSKDPAEARRLRQALAEIPGEASAEARARLEALPKPGTP